MTPSIPDEPTSHPSSEPPSAAPEAAGLERTPDQVLADAVRVLTEAARLTRPVLVRDEAASEGAAYPVWVTGPHREPADWAEFVTQALAGAVANVGSIDAALSGRPGSWEADGVRNLLTSTVGYDEASLLEHRTEPIVVELFVDEILVDVGGWKPYDDVQREIAARYDALGIPTASTPEGAALLAPATDEQERQADELADLEERLEQQRERDWAAYGEALKAAVEAAAGGLEGLRVPVVVTVDLQTCRRAEDRGGDSWGPAERLLDQVIQVDASARRRSAPARAPVMTAPPAPASGRRDTPGRRPVPARPRPSSSVSANSSLGGMMYAQVIALCNQKGGVGKTTITVNLADALTQQGRRVLLVDADPQANATANLGIEDTPPFTLNDVLTVDPQTRQVAAGVLAEAVVDVGEGWRGVQLVAAELALAGREQDQDLGREYRLRTALEGTLGAWDVVLIDCPPSLGQLTVNALTAADCALLVTEPRAASVDGLAQMTRTVATVRQHFNADLRLAGVVVNRYRADRRDRVEWADQLRADYGEHLLEPFVPEREIVATAASAAAPLSAYGARARDVTDALTAIATRVLPAT